MSKPRTTPSSTVKHSPQSTSRASGITSDSDEILVSISYCIPSFLCSRFDGHELWVKTTIPPHSRRPRRLHLLLEQDALVTTRAEEHQTYSASELNTAPQIIPPPLRRLPLPVPWSSIRTILTFW